jgi:SdrD B-like domain
VPLIYRHEFEADALYAGSATLGVRQFAPSAGTGVVACLGSLLSCAAFAAGESGATVPQQNAHAAVVEVRALSRFEAEQEKLKELIASRPKAYEDQVMDATALASLPEADDMYPNQSGLGLRTYSVESRFGQSRSSSSGYDSTRSSEWGLRTEIRQETLNYGDWVLQADARTGRSTPISKSGNFGTTGNEVLSRVTLKNFGLPITSSIFADTALGDINSEVTDAFSRNYRLSLGNSRLRGISTRVFGQDFDLRAGTGQRSFLIGDPYPGFQRNQGSLSWLGYTQRLASEFYAGAQVMRATDVTTFTPSFYSPANDSASNGPLETIDSYAVSIGYGQYLLKDGDFKARVMLLRSRVNAAQSSPGVPVESRNAHGVSVEGGYLSGGYRHEFGSYVASPDLRSGDALLASDNRGVYWRVDHNTARLNWGAGFDFEQQNPGEVATRLSANRLTLNANAQYRVDRDTAVGATANVSNTRYNNTGSSGVFAASGDGMRSINASVYYQTRFYDWGRSRFTVTAQRNQALVANGLAATGTELQWEHDWITRKYENTRPEFITTLGLAQDRSTGSSQTFPTAGVVFRYWAASDWNIGGNLRYTSRSSNLSSSQGISGSLNTEHRLGGGWQLGASASLNQNVTNFSSNSSFVPQTLRSNNSSFYIFLRWDGSSGRPLQAIGQRSSVGGGSISGVVYLDANRDGEQQAGEAGAANVEVLLDGRYRVTTDRNGQFEFAVVATGNHQLSLNLESVPLPWGAAFEKGININVPLRGQATTRIPVVRVGE